MTPCSECGTRKPASGYYRSNLATCKVCVKARAARRRQADREAHRQASRRWRERERTRHELLTMTLRFLAGWYPDRFAEAVRSAEDALGVEPGTALDLFARQNHASSAKGRRSQ